MTSRADNTIDVYEVVDSVPDAAALPAPSSSPTRLPSSSFIRTSTRPPLSTLSVVHRRTLFGHTASVSSVAVDAVGRCVSGGVDGRVKVWDVGEKWGDGLTITETGEGERASGSWEEIRKSADDGGGAEREAGELAGRRIKRLFFDEEKIVSIVDSRGGGEETVMLLSFD